MSVTSAVEVISPETAAAWICHMRDGQRPLSKHTVSRYANDMLTGRWKLNGDSIKFDCNGRLMDGQHRLFAAMESGVTFESLVVRGVSSDEDTFQTTDYGMLKKTSDFIQTPFANSVAAVAGWHLIYLKHKTLKRVGRYSDRIEAMKMLSPDIQEYIAGLASESRAPGGIVRCKSLVMYILFFYRKFSPLPDRLQSNLTQFFKSLGDGIGLEKNSPVWALRTRLTSGVGTRQSDKPPINHVSALLIKMLTASLEGKSVSQARFVDATETFPKLHPGYYFQDNDPN